MITKSKYQTQKFAAKLAKTILAERSPVPHRGIRAKKILKAKSSKLKAAVIALSGDLGAGKTTFTQGFVKALGVKHHVTSPTFLIVRRYEIPEPKSSKLKAQSYLNVFHFDLYRIHSIGELAPLHFKKIMNNPQNIVLLEWPERIKKSLPKSVYWIYFEHGKNIKERVIRVTGKS